MSHSLIHTLHTFSSPPFFLLASLSPLLPSHFTFSEAPPTFPPRSRPTFTLVLTGTDVLVLKARVVRVYVTPIGWSCLLSQLFCSLSLRKQRYPAVPIGTRSRSELPSPNESRASQMCDPAEQNGSMLTILNRVIKRANALFHQSRFLSAHPTPLVMFPSSRLLSLSL